MDKKQLDQAVILDKINKALTDSVYIYDLDQQKVIWLNESGQKFYGRSLSEMQTAYEPQFDWIHPEDQQIMIDTPKKCRTLKDGEVISIEYRYKNHEGKYRWLHDRITVFARNEKGEVSTILGVAADINDRKAYELDLKKTIEKLNLSLAAAKMGTWEWDIEQNELIWDDRMYEIHDVPNRPDLSPMAEVWKRADQEEMQVIDKKVRAAVEKQEAFYTTYKITYDNKEVHHISSYGKFYTSQKMNRMYGVAWDSTVEVQTEHQIFEAKAKLIASTKMAALGEMSGGIAHEINNPLTVIQARAFQLSQMVEANKIDPEKIKQASESISRTADKIARIIKSLRSFAREGTYDPFEVVSVKQIIEETLEFCKTRFYNHGVEVELEEIDPDLEVECRLVQIEQVLLNLLNNSFDAIQNLEEKWIRLSVKEHDDTLEIIVTDSGKGIPKEIAEKIMHPFFTTKEVGKGTGLGLSISEGIIRSHKGTLILKTNTPNTTFKIHLPKLQNDDL